MFGRGGTGFGDTLLTPVYQTVLDVIYESRDGIVADPFARKSHALGYSTFEYTNDLNPEMPTKHHLDVHEFLEHVIDVPIWGSLIDPPFTPGQVREIYSSVGPKEGSREIRRMYDHCFEVLGDNTKVGGFMMSFGYHSEGSMRPDFHRIAVVAYYAGSAHKDVYMVVERKGSLEDCKRYQESIAHRIPVSPVPATCVLPDRVFNFRVRFSAELTKRGFELIASPMLNPIGYLASLAPDPHRKFFIEAPMTSTHLARWVDTAGRAAWTDTKNHPRFLSQMFRELYRLKPAIVVLKFLTSNGIYESAGFHPVRTILLPNAPDIFGDTILTINVLHDTV